MYVSEVRLWNFRKYGDARDIDLGRPHLKVELTPGLNVLIGANDSGKTAVIDALKIVLKTHSHEWITIAASDFFEDSAELRIEVICKGMADNEASHFTEWLGWEGSGTGAQPYLRLIYHVKRTQERIFPSEVRAGTDAVGRVMSADAREYLKTTYLKPLRDAKSELIAKRSSRLSQIFRGHSAFKGKNKTHDFVVSFEKINKEIQEYFKGKKADGITEHSDQEGKRLKDKIDEFIKAFCGEEEISDIKVSQGDLVSILERLEIAMLDRMNPGLGTLNRLFMGTELVHISTDPWEGLRIGLIEELEAHLSPQAQMQVVEKLQSEENIQLILTTHSPNLASKVKLENLIICTANAVFPMGQKYTKLAFDDYVFLEKFLDVTKANLFFAKGIILVEGWAEEILVPSLAKKLGFDLTKYGVSVVNVGSTAFLRYSSIFLRKSEGERMNVPVAIITDADVPYFSRQPSTDKEGRPISENGKTVYHYEKRNIETVNAETKAATTRINSKFDEDDIKSFVAPYWTLEYSLLQSAVIGGPLKDALKNVHTDTEWDADFEKALGTKLLNKGLKKTEVAYSLAQAIDSGAINLDEIEIDGNDSMSYLTNAIRHACRVTDN